MGHYRRIDSQYDNVMENFLRARKILGVSFEFMAKGVVWGFDVHSVVAAFPVDGVQR